MLHHHRSPTSIQSHGGLRPNPNPNSPLPPFALHFHSPSSRWPLTSSLRLSNHSKASPSSPPPSSPPSPSPPNLEDEISRRHNSTSTALILLNSRPKSGHNRDADTEHPSLLGKRIFRFPGSVDFPGIERIDPQPQKAALVVADDDETLRRAVEVRRRVAADALKGALRAGKLRVNYSAGIVARVTEFVDRVVIGAAAMKGDPSSPPHLSFGLRAKSYIRSSGVVELVKWLKHNHLTLHQIGKVICMCSDDLLQVRRVCEWLKTIHVKGDFLGVVLLRGGPIWERSSDELEEIIHCLEKNGVRRDWLGFVVRRCPHVLALTMEEVESRVKFYLDMGLNDKDFGTMVFDYPKVFGFFTLEEMNSKVKYLKEFGLSTEDVGKLLAFRPQLMGCSIEEKWKPLVKYLHNLGIRRDGMKRILTLKPMVFCVDLETIIAPRVQFLREIGVREETIGGVIVKFPPFLTYSFYKKIRPVVIFLMTKGCVTQRDIGKVIALDPQLTGCSIINKLEVNVKYLLSLGILPRLLGEMIADFPTLLRYNVDVLRPKYRYLRRIMARPLKDLIEFPRFFSYSLEDRIIPRHKIMVENKINFKLRYMLRDSDEDFDQRVLAAVQRRKKFESRNVDINVSDSELPCVHLLD